jgi:hypothetical protein
LAHSYRGRRVFEGKAADHPAIGKEGRLKGYRLSGTARVTWRFLRSDLDAKMLPPSAAITEEYAAEK